MNGSMSRLAYIRCKQTIPQALFENSKTNQIFQFLDTSLKHPLERQEEKKTSDTPTPPSTAVLINEVKNDMNADFNPPGTSALNGLQGEKKDVKDLGPESSKNPPNPKPMSLRPGGLGRGAKSLARLMLQKSSSTTPDCVPSEDLKTPATLPLHQQEKEQNQVSDSGKLEGANPDKTNSMNQGSQPIPLPPPLPLPSQSLPPHGSASQPVQAESLEPRSFRMPSSGPASTEHHPQATFANQGTAQTQDALPEIGALAEIQSFQEGISDPSTNSAQGSVRATQEPQGPGQAQPQIQAGATTGHSRGRGFGIKDIFALKSRTATEPKGNEDLEHTNEPNENRKSETEPDQCSISSGASEQNRSAQPLARGRGGKNLHMMMSMSSTGRSGHGGGDPANQG